MKKTLIALSLTLAAVAASAADVTGFVKYDYDRAEATPTWVSGHRVTTGAKVGFGALGAVDAGFVAGQAVVGGNRINGNGFDLGYSNGLTLGPVALTGRVGYGEVRSGRIQGLGYAQVNRTTAGVDATLAVDKTVSLLAGYEYQDLRIKWTDTTVGSGNGHRFTVGADFALTDKLGVRAVYARSRAEGQDANGVTTALTYKF